MKTARYWHRREDGGVQCELCPHGCVLAEGATGVCRVRAVRSGQMQALAYGNVSSAHVDPVEKKPLHHFYPGRNIFSVGSWGCNFRCAFCQNWTISQQLIPEGREYTPEQVVAAGAEEDSIGIAYTYNEPCVGIEFVEDCARLAHARGLVNVLVTNGYVNPAPASELLPWVDALNIDIKSMDDSFYRRHCGGRLQPVLDFCMQSVRAGCHVEITNLLIPHLNDDMAGVRRLAEWIADNLGPRTPLHLSGYHPQYKLTEPATPPATLEKAAALCRTILTYVYVGNVLTADPADTKCPGCGAILIRRRGYATHVTGIQDGACADCGRAADVVFSPRRA